VCDCGVIVIGSFIEKVVSAEPSPQFTSTSKSPAGVLFTPKLPRLNDCELPAVASWLDAGVTAMIATCAVN
jgi:hypothetical protein